MLPLRRTAVAAAIWLGCTANASAHDVWLSLSGSASARRVIVNYGHPGDRPPALPDKIVELVAVGAKDTRSLLPGVALAQDRKVTVARSAPIRDDGRLFAARYDNGYWAKTKDGLYRNATRRTIPDAAERIWSGKFAKAIGTPNAPWDRVLGQELELVPMSDPAQAKIGDTLKLRVLFRGKPLTGAQVERGDGVTKMAEEAIPKFTTDADGVASVPIVSAGVQLLVVDHRSSPSLSPDQADADLFNATLWFRVGAKE